MSVGGEEVSAHNAAVAGWEVLHNTMRSLDIESRQDLSEWISQPGFSHAPDGEPISAGEHRNGSGTRRSPEMVRGMGCEALYVHIVMEGCRGDAMEVEEPEPGMRTQDRPQTGEEDLDDVCLRRVFECRFHVVHCCPAFFKGRFRHAVRVALETRQQAVAVGDATAEVRAWKLFPFMLLRRPVGEGTSREGGAVDPI